MFSMPDAFFETNCVTNFRWSACARNPTIVPGTPGYPLVGIKRSFMKTLFPTSQVSYISNREGQGGTEKTIMQFPDGADKQENAKTWHIKKAAR